jgi:formamidopyrimidine-DNA glycosylase
MPELPEVETMVRDLATHIAGRTITAVSLPFAGQIQYPDPSEFVGRVQGRRIERIERRAKFAAFALDSPDLLIIHRGMTGSLLLRSRSDPYEAHVRAVFTLDDGRELRFNDPRKFGKLYLMDLSGSERPLPWARMGPEPLSDDFTARNFESRLRERRAPIKPLLLGQSIVAGLGNIYVDEALHLSRIHPQRRANDLSMAEIRRLHRAIRSVLVDAVERRGTTFSTYMDFEGRAGGFQDQLRVFHREGRSCPRCNTDIIKLVVGGRGTHICPRCQKV